MKVGRIIAATALAGAVAWVPATTAGATPNTDKDRCKNGGYATLPAPGGGTFRNQGQCIAYVNSGGSFGESAPPAG